MHDGKPLDLQPEAVEQIELDAFLSEPDQEYDWVVPRLLERTDRVILTGREGTGKSTLLRQIGVQLACGIHPFTGDRIDPVRTAMVDLENQRRLVRRRLRTLRAAAGDDYKPEPGMFVVCRPQGLDLLNADDARKLHNLCAAVRPSLLIIGPLYKMATGDPLDEQIARAVAGVLDRLRIENGCTLLIEAHSPYGASNSRRPERPYGASLWSRWPDFGVFLSPEGHLRHWRVARDERDWPAILQRGGTWPWTPVERPREVLWARIVDLCTEAGDQLSIRDLAKLTGSSVGLVHKVIEEHRSEWDALPMITEEQPA